MLTVWFPLSRIHWRPKTGTIQWGKIHWIDIKQKQQTTRSISSSNEGNTISLFWFDFTPPPCKNSSYISTFCMHAALDLERIDTRNPGKTKPPWRDLSIGTTFDVFGGKWHLGMYPLHQEKSFCLSFLCFSHEHTPFQPDRISIRNPGNNWSLEHKESIGICFSAVGMRESNERIGGWKCHVTCMGITHHPDRIQMTFLHESCSTRSGLSESISGIDVAACCTMLFLK